MTMATGLIRCMAVRGRARPRPLAAAVGLRRASTTKATLPKGFLSPQAVVDAVANAVAAVEAGAASDVAPSDTNKSVGVSRKSHNLDEPISSMERRRLEGDVVATKDMTGSQLLMPRQTPDWQIIKPEHFEDVPTPKDWEKQLEKLQQRLGVKFEDLTLLRSALTHHGVLPQQVVQSGLPVDRLSNRSLEFLGDSILGVAAASYLFQLQPLHAEGQLTRAKAAVVNNEVLALVSKTLGIMNCILWPTQFSPKCESSKPTYIKGRNTIAAGAVEAVIAAIYLDQGMAAAMAFVGEKVLPVAVKLATREAIWEPGVELQNLLQGHHYGQPMYKFLPSPLKADYFTAELFVKGRSVLKATAPSYKEARVRAADAAYWHFRRLLGPVP